MALKAKSSEWRRGDLAGENAAREVTTKYGRAFGERNLFDLQTNLRREIRLREAGDFDRGYVVGYARGVSAADRGLDHATKKKSPTRLQREIDEVLAKAPPRSKFATIIVYSRPSGYWYAQAHDATTGARITDASGYSREDVLRALRAKFVMIGVTIKSITNEDPYLA
jgi:hypothetical protein